MGQDYRTLLVKQVRCLFISNHLPVIHSKNDMLFVIAYLTGCLSATLLIPEPWEWTTLDTTTTASTTTTTWTQSSNQLTEKEKCELNPVQLHVAKRGKVIRQGSNSVIIRVKQPIPSNSNYTALVIFDRQVCGIDFLRQLYNSWDSGVR